MLKAEIADREVTIRSQKDGQPLNEAYWLIFGAKGFKTEEEAREFGNQLRQIVEIAALCTRLGVNVGDDRSGAWMSREFALSMGLIQPHERMMPNVHGLMVLPDDDLSRFLTVEGHGKVMHEPAQLVTSLNELGRQVPVQVSAAAAGVRVLNLALMASAPLAQIVLALSAVEELGQGESWSEGQKALLEELADQVTRDADNDAERREVADALRRSLHRIGLRQGVMRVLARLELDHLRKEWDSIYKRRSGIFHGTARLTENEISELAQASIDLCTKIVLAVAKVEGLQVPTATGTYFPE